MPGVAFTEAQTKILTCAIQDYQQITGKDRVAEREKLIADLALQVSSADEQEDEEGMATIRGVSSFQVDFLAEFDLNGSRSKIGLRPMQKSLEMRPNSLRPLVGTLCLWIRWQKKFGRQLRSLPMLAQVRRITLLSTEKQLRI